MGNGTHQNLSCLEDFFSTIFGIVISLSFSVIFFDNWPPAINEVFKVSSRENTPLAAPKVVSFCFESPGTNASISSLNLVLFPDWEAKWMVGVQKPETQIQSHLIFSIFPSCFLSSEIFAISAELTFLYPCAATTTCENFILIHATLPIMRC